MLQPTRSLEAKWTKIHPHPNPSPKIIQHDLSGFAPETRSQKSERVVGSASLENLESEGMIPHLPQEIRLNILFRLPVESLIRCTSVRKSWRTVIKDESFIGDYNSWAKNYAIENGTQLLLVHGTAFTFEVERGIVSGALLGDEVYSLHYDDPTFLEHSRIRVPVVPRWNICFRVAGICEGIVS